MGKNIKIIASVIPVSQKIENNTIKVMVRFTPRLPDTGTLLDYYEIRHWYNYFNLFVSDKMGFIFRGENFHPLTGTGTDEKPISVFASSMETAGYRGDIQYQQLSDCTKNQEDNSYLKKIINTPCKNDKSKEEENDTEKSKKNLPISLWHSMFPDDTPVSGWIMNELPYELLKKLGIEELHNDFVKAIDNTIQHILASGNTKSDDPFNSIRPDNELTNERENIIDQLHSLKKLSPDIILTAPMLKNSGDHIQVLLKNLYDRLQIFKEKRIKEIRDLSVEMSLSEQEKRNVDESFEFHKKLSAYSNFPFLLKQTGWLWEYFIKIPPNISLKKIKYIQLADLNKYDDINVQLNEHKSFYSNIDFKQPLTAINIDKNNWLNVSRKPKLDNINKPDDFIQIENGIIKPKADNSKIEIKPRIIEKNQLFEKINKFLEVNYHFGNEAEAASTGNQTKIAQAADELGVDKRNQFVALNAEQNKLLDEKNTIDDGYVSSGISVNLVDAHTVTKTAIDANQDILLDEAALDKSVKEIIYGSGIIYLEHIHAGYRVDVLDKCKGGVQANNIKSLCKRDVFYTYQEWDETNKELGKNCRCIGDQDEGWLVDSLQASNSGNLYTDEELFRWNDWSLVATRIFKTVNDIVAEDKGKQNINELSIDEFKRKSDEDNASPEEILSLDSNLKIFSLPAVNIGKNNVKTGTLPKLRFNNKYQFRLRFVDACGQSVSKDNSSKTSLFSEEIPYKRTDPVHAPVIHLAEKLKERNLVHGKWLTEHWGEDVATLVIRSKAINDTIEYDGTDAVRFIGPKRADFHFVKKHGVLDDLFSNSETSLDEKDINRIIELTTEEKREKFKEHEKEHIIKEKNDKAILNYFYDPVVDGFEFIIDKNSFPQKSIYFSKTDYWDMLKNNEPTYVQLIIKNEDKDEIKFQPLTPPYKKITIGLPAGFEKELVLKPMVHNDYKNIFYNDYIIREATKLKIIHAVQKPVLLNKPIEVKNHKGDFTCHRKPLQSEINLNIHFDEFPVQTSDTYNLHIYYKEVVSDLTIKYDNNPDPKDNNPKPEDNGGWICNVEKGYKEKFIHRIIKTGINPDDSLRDEKVNFNNIIHTLGDTKYRQIYYSLEAVSRFRKYFDPEKFKDFSIFGKPGGLKDIESLKDFDDYLLNKNEENKFAHLSTRQPAIPVIDKVVPLLTWENDGEGITERKCDTIRIYFEGDWYSSGENERLVVFYSKHGVYNSSNVVSNDDKINFENIISQFGNDPTVKNKLCILLNNETIEGEHCIRSLDNIPISILDFENKADLLKNLADSHIDSDKLLGAAEFIIQYEPAKASNGNIENGKYYADIKINDDVRLQNIYFPFIRFAIARYQENSIQDGQKYSQYQFSKIVLTDFVNLLPYRKINGNAEIIGPGRILSASEKNTNILRYRKNATYVDEFTIDICNKRPNISNADSFDVIEEYEDYAFKDMYLKPDENEPQTDYTKRLIFAYVKKTDRNEKK